MNGLFELIDQGFSVSWDPEILSQHWQVISPGGYQVYSSPGGEPHWQYFRRAQIYFSRNFDLNYPDETQQIINYLRGLQSRHSAQTNHSDLMKLFLKHRVNAANITLIRIDPGSEVQLHTDRSRKASINIGLKNSTAGITKIWSGPVVPETYINEHNTMYTYQMQDGQTYIVNVDQPHCVAQAPGATGARYIVSYTIC